jgi:hypothetical protein
LLVFEADSAAIIHMMDPPDLFAYKRPHMRRAFAAFFAMLQRRAGDSAPGSGGIPGWLRATSKRFLPGTPHLPLPASEEGRGEGLAPWLVRPGRPG